MRRGWVAGAIAAIATGGVLMGLDARDFAHEPPTDTADVVATFGGLAGVAIWFALRWGGTTRTVQLLRAAAAGVAIGAVVVGLASVVYDPFAS